MVARVVGELAAAADPGLAAWIARHVSFVTTMVDRITPQTTDDDRAQVQAWAGVDDPVPVVTEPYVEWVLCGEFPQGRPRWEDVGARFVDDVVPWEHRKLWLLNGSHSLMAYAGTLRGHETVQEAVSDPVVRGWVEQWWDDAARHLPLPHEEITAYRAALLERYANPRIRHLLRQIAADGSQKVPIRILPTVRADLAEGRVPAGAARVLAAWMCHLRGLGAPVADVAAEEFTALATGDLDDAAGRVLARLDVDDERLRAAVASLASELGG
jgi:fructuronate reductase